jgi:hypothetical protein
MVNSRIVRQEVNRWIRRLDETFRVPSIQMKVQRTRSRSIALPRNTCVILFAASLLIACQSSSTDEGGGGRGTPEEGGNGGVAVTPNDAGTGGTAGANGLAGGSGGTLATGGNGGALVMGGMAGTPGTGGMAAMGGSGGTASAAPWCKFLFGTEWKGKNAVYQPNMTSYSSWAGWEWDGAPHMYQDEFVTALRDGVPAQFKGAVPVYIAYLIPFMARKDWDLQDCNVRTCDEGSADCKTLCTYGSAYIRAKRTQILGFYKEYAKKTAALWGTQKPFVWQLESDSYQYATNPHQFRDPPGTAGNVQNSGLGFAELGKLMADIIDTIKAEMPNALCSIHVAAWNPDQAGYFAGQKLAKIDLLHFSAESRGEFLDRGASGNPQSKWAYIRNLTGKLMFVDGGTYPTTLAKTWQDGVQSEYEERIKQGVIGVTINAPPASWGTLSQTLGDKLPSLCR